MLIQMIAAAAANAADPPQPVPLPGDPAAGRPVALTAVALAPRPLLLELGAADLRDRIGAALAASGYPDRTGDLSLTAELSAATCKGAVARGCEVALTWDLVGPDGRLVWTGLTRGSSWAERGAEAGALDVSLDRAVASLLASPSFAAVVARSPARAWSAGPGSVTVRRCDAPAPDPMAAVVRVEGPGGAGSGVVISPDGFVATAAGLVGGAEQVEAWTRDGTPLSARAVRVDPDGRVAVLRVDGSAHPCLPEGPWPDESEQVRALGVPLHAAASPTASPTTAASPTEQEPRAGDPPVATPPDAASAAPAAAAPAPAPAAAAPAPAAPAPAAPAPAPAAPAPVATVAAAVGPVTEADPSALRGSPESWTGFAGGALVDGSGQWVGVLGDRLDGVPADAFRAATRLEFADATGPLTGSPIALPPTPAPAYQARPDPSWLMRRPTAGQIRGHFVLGAAATLASSGLVVLQTGRTYQDWKAEGATVNEWRALQLANTGGWLLGGLGVAFGVRAATIREPDPVGAATTEMTP